MSNQAVFGIMRDEATMQWMLTVLGRAGFAAAEISVLMPPGPPSGFAGTRDRRPAAGTARTAAATVSGGTRGLLGTLGTLGRLGALAIPGFGPLIAAGPILTALGSAAVGAGMGSVAGGLIGLGIPEAHAKRYEGKLRGGNLLVAVHTTGVPHIAAATTVLETHGAHDMVIASGLPPRGELIARPTRPGLRRLVPSRGQLCAPAVAAARARPLH